jgi:hypothetical protein
MWVVEYTNPLEAATEAVDALPLLAEPTGRPFFRGAATEAVDALPLLVEPTGRPFVRGFGGAAGAGAAVGAGSQPPLLSGCCLSGALK